MKIANKYNHLHAEEYLLVRKKTIFNELKDCIRSVDANQCLKVSGDMSKLGMVFYNQDSINDAFMDEMRRKGWDSNEEYYYVTSDEDITREIVKIKDKHKQKEIIEDSGLSAYSTSNQVDFQKDEVAVEMQFGKYSFVTYDLHVKHTFFYSRGDINVGIEIIPTKAMEKHMDGGVPYFEKEVNNVIRGGRTNPPIPILILGIQPDVFCSYEPRDFTENEYLKILKSSSSRTLSSLRENIKKALASSSTRADIANRIKIIQPCLEMV